MLPGQTNERDGRKRKKQDGDEGDNRRELKEKETSENMKKGNEKRSWYEGSGVLGKRQSVYDACAHLFSLHCEGRRQIAHMDKSRRWPGCVRNQLVLAHSVVGQ